jgi:lipopolysaccharide export system protein LptA
MVKNSRFYFIFIILFLASSEAGGQIPGGSWELLHAETSTVRYGGEGTRVVFLGDVRFVNGTERYESRRVVYEENRGRIIMDGDVKLYRGGTTIFADTLVFYLEDSKTELKGHVCVRGDEYIIESKEALLFSDGAMLFDGDIILEMDGYMGLADRLQRSASGDSVTLYGTPYIIMEERYIGGDAMTLYLKNDDVIDYLMISGHGDLFWNSDHQEMGLQSRLLYLYFTPENELSEVQARGDVKGVIKDGATANHFYGDSMDITFFENEPRLVLLTGKAGGSAVGLEKNEESGV